MLNHLFSAWGPRVWFAVRLAWALCVACTPLDPLPGDLEESNEASSGQGGSGAGDGVSTGSNAAGQGGNATTDSSLTTGSSGAAGSGASSAAGGASPSCTPSAELCDGKDNDCDGEIDDGVKRRCWADSDADGYALANAATSESCDQCGAKLTAVDPASADGLDCDDSDPTKSPGGTDVCGDSVDNDCDGTPDNEAENACGGPCTTRLAGKPGQECSNGLQGACARMGVYECLPDHNLRCTAPEVEGVAEVCGDSSDNDYDGMTDNGCVRNACGGWAQLEDDRGAPCSVGEGSCLSMGSYECDGMDATVCNARPKNQNRCGGCAPLSPEPGARCTADCGATGEYVCEGMDETVCNAVAKPRNDCGGCDTLFPPVNTPCTADCGGLGRYVCDGTDRTECNAQPNPRNDCGGCLPLRLGVSCTGTCGVRGETDCDGTERTLCRDLETVIRNECGGCEPIPADRARGQGCSDGTGTCVFISLYECSGFGDRATTTCPARALRPDNDCGGCGPLDGTPGTECDPATGAVWTCAPEGYAYCP